MLLLRPFVYAPCIWVASIFLLLLVRPKKNATHAAIFVAGSPFFGKLFVAERNLKEGRPFPHTYFTDPFATRREINKIPSLLESLLILYLLSLHFTACSTFKLVSLYVKLLHFVTMSHIFSCFSHFVIMTGQKVVGQEQFDPVCPLIPPSLPSTL